jgi:dsDNA-specific endonuclease/ATPase MutS2
MGAYECRVCKHVGVEPKFCPHCLAETMRETDQALPPTALASSPAAEPDATAIPIDGVLDLHTVAFGEVKAVVVAYVEECARLGIFELRIIHGKGTGSLRRTVHAALARLPVVKEFTTADALAGGWGATVVTLHRRS